MWLRHGRIPDGATGGPVSSGSEEACIHCHDESRGESREDHDRYRGSRTRPPGHEAVFPAGSDVACMTCHDPHAAGSTDLLRRRSEGTFLAAQGDLDPGSRLCLDCHPNHGQWNGGPGGYRRHPVGIRVPLARLAVGDDLTLALADVRGTDDRSDDVIACATCHDVHASRREYLLRWPREETVAWCTACHAVSGEPRGATLLAFLRTRESRPGAGI